MTTLFNMTSASEKIQSLYEIVRDAQDNLPSAKLVDSIFDRVMAGCENQPTEHDYDLFCDLMNEHDSIMHP